MSNFNAQLESVFIAGMSGSGKTTFALKLLLNTPAACRFIFDEKGEVSARLNKKHIGTAQEWCDALASRYVCLNPSRMWPGCLPGTDQAALAFKWFCHQAREDSKRGRGRKIVFIDELWKWCDTRKLPLELAIVAQDGRLHEMMLVTATQTPEKIPFAIRGQATEVIVFKLGHTKATEALEDLQLPGFDADEIFNLPLGSFISFDRTKGTKFAGKIF